MTDLLSSTREQNQKCILLCEAAIQLFANERDFLRLFQIENLLQNTSEKGSVLEELRAERQKLKEMRRGHEEKLFKDQDAEWSQVWERLHAAALENQNLIEHSLHNVQNLADNFRHLFLGQHRYSSSGVMHEGEGTGKVVEDKY